jgi:hypothetical protein
VPAGFLAAFADGTSASIVPKPGHVRAAVTDELGSRGVPHPEAVTVTLLPEVSLA